MSEPIQHDDDWTEAFDANIPRVDLVGKAANGVPSFLLMKQDQGGLMPAHVVRDLIKQATPEAAEPTRRDDITMTGSPAAIAAMIAAAPMRKAATPTGEHTMPADETTEAVAKADSELDAGTVLADSSDPTAESLPGSPAWEQLDADTAMKWTAILSRAKNALQLLAGREMQESATGDGDDRENAWDLEDACCAVDCAISILATFAAGEQAEADLADDLEKVGKAVESVDPATLAVLEGLAPVVKAGRVLSSANESAIRGAVESLTKVLDSLPQAPTTDDIAKSEETDMASTPSTITVNVEVDPATLAKAKEQIAEVVKAKGDPLTPVYDETGKLVGMVAQANLVPIAPASAPAADGAPAEDVEPMVQPDANDGPAADTADASTDTAPAPVAAPETPAAPAADDDTMQKALDEIELLKSTFADALAAAVAPLEKRLAEVEAQPMPGGPMLNGAKPGADPIALRGQDEATQESDLKKAFEAEMNPIRKQELQMQLAAQMVRNAPRLP